MHKLLIALVIIILVFIVITIGSNFWLERSSDSCWKYESENAFNNYGRYKNVSEVLNAAASTGREVINNESGYFTIIESDPNACSLGSNGQTILKFYFDHSKRLTKMQVYRNYITNEPDYQMELIDERVY